MDLRELDLVDPESHWYYRTKLAAIETQLARFVSAPRRIVEVGAGSGFFARSLTQPDDGESAVCVDVNYTSERTERNGALVFRTFATSREMSEANVLLFIDVLEHVAADDELLSSYVDRARPGTLVVVTVPAFMSMWSAHDLYLGHHRRYRLSQVVSLAERARLSVRHARYLFGAVLPPAWAVRQFRRTGPPTSDLRPLPSLLNQGLVHLLMAEHAIPANRLFGLSVLVVAQVA